MDTNLFEEFQQKKAKVRKLANAALDKGWLETDDYSKIINKLDTDTLTIGIIGQMKCGKSTFLNAFLFNDMVLPAATNPMTAALTVITYGEKQDIVAEFYSPDEWANLKMQAERQLDEEPSDNEIDMKQAAMEVYSKSKTIANEIPNLLGKTQKDNFENLIEYVGAEGKYVSITKSVTVHYPVEWLKGIEIVDTPGFNDPIVSRELRTQEFLSKADMVLVLLYAGHAFDATDRDIVFEKVRKVGIGKILVGINKYDLLITKESEEEIISNVEDEIKKACRNQKYRDDVLIQEAMRGVKPILLSANMALMAKMPLSKVYEDPDLRFHFNESCKAFDNDKQDQSQMLKDSLIENLENAIREIIEKSKEEILIKKPINHIFQLAKNRCDELKTTIAADGIKLKDLKTPDSEIESKLDHIKKAQKRIEREIERATLKLGEKFDELVEDGIDKMQQIIFDAREDCMRIATTARRSEVGSRINYRIDRLNQRDLSNAHKDYKKDFIKEIKNSCEDFADEVEKILERFFDDCDEIKETFQIAIRRGANSIRNSARDDELELFDSDFENKSIATWQKIVFPVGIISALKNWREDVSEEVQDHFRQYSLESLKEATKKRRHAYINLLKTEATSKLLGDLVDTFTKALDSKEKKEQLIIQSENSLKENEKMLQELELQISELKTMVNL